MANRYWVGGTGTWNQTSTANWSTTSGGSSGASAPTTTNGVYFDANSGGGTVDVQDAGGGTFPCCASLDFSGFTGTFDSSSGVLEVFGDITLSAEAGVDFNLFVANIYGTSCLFNSQNQGIQDLYAGGQSTTTGLVYSPTVSLYNNNLNCSGIFVFSQGTFNTNDLSVNAQYYLWGTPDSVESTTINMGDSYFGVSNGVNPGQGWTIRYNTSPSEVTVNAGTSVIEFYNSVSSSISLYDGAISSISSLGKTYYRLYTYGVADVTIYGNNTFDEFRVYNPPRTLTFAAGSTQTVSIFKVSGTAGNLVTLQSTSPGSQFTLYQATGLVSVDYVSLQDSAATGGAIYYAGANSTDVSNNTGWLFTAQPPVSRYWVGGTGTWDGTDTTHWSATSGGTGGVYAPTSIDTVIFDANSGSGTITVTSNAGDPQGGSLDCTGFTGTIVPQLYDFAPITLSGNLTLGTAGTYGIQNYNLTIEFIGNATMVSNGTTNSHLNIYVWNGAVLTLGDEIKVSYLGIFTPTYTASTTLNTNNYNVTALGVEVYGDYPCTINLGSSSLTLSSFYTDFNTILDAGTSTFNMAYDVFQDPYNWEFYGGGLTYYNLNFLTDADTDTGYGGVHEDATFHNITNSVQPITVIFNALSTQTITGTFGLSGTAGNLVTIRSESPGTQFTLSKASGTVSCDYLSIQDSAATGGADWYAGANSTDVSNNTGWTFTAPPSPGAQSVSIGGGITIGGSIQFS